MTDLLNVIKKEVEKMASDVAVIREREEALLKGEATLAPEILEASKLLEELQGMITESLENPEEDSIQRIKDKANELAELMSAIMRDSQNVTRPISHDPFVGSKDPKVKFKKSLETTKIGGMVSENAFFPEGSPLKQPSPSEIPDFVKNLEDPDLKVSPKLGESLEEFMIRCAEEGGTERQCAEFFEESNVSKYKPVESPKELNQIVREAEGAVEEEQENGEEYLRFINECSKISDPEKCDALWNTLTKGRDKATYPFPKDEETEETESEGLGDKEERELARTMRAKPQKSEIRDPIFEKLQILKGCFTKAFKTGVLDVPHSVLVGLHNKQIKDTLEEARFEYQDEIGSRYVPRFGKEIKKQVEVRINARDIQKGRPFKRTYSSSHLIEKGSEPINVGKMNWKEIHALAKKLGV